MGPRVWVTISALTEASATSGRPIVESSPSATSRTRSIVIVLPGSASSSSTSSSVPTSTRYCFPPVSMTAYMDPRGSCLATARGDRDIGREKARGEADAQNEKCTAPSTKRSIATAEGTPGVRLTRPRRSAPIRSGAGASRRDVGRPARCVPYRSFLDDHPRWSYKRASRSSVMAAVWRPASARRADFWTARRGAPCRCGADATASDAGATISSAATVYRLSGRPSQGIGGSGRVIAHDAAARGRSNEPPGSTPAASPSAAITSSGRPLPRTGSNRVRARTTTGGPGSRTARSASSGRRS